MMTSALLAGSAVIVAPLAEKLVGLAAGAFASGAVGAAVGTAPAMGALPRKSEGVCDSVDPPRGAAAVRAGQHGAQRLRDAHGLGILEVDDEHVAARPAGRVQLLDQLPHARQAAGIVGTHQDAVRARIRHDRHALLGVERTGPGGAGIREQTIQQRHDVERRRVPERHE